VVSAVLAAGLLASCAVRGLAFEDDERVDIVSPADRASVQLPLTIRWRTSDLRPAATGGPSFAVFVDRAPIRPGQHISALADDACERRRGCPDAAYLRSRYVFLTDATSVTVDALPTPTGQRTAAENRHHATIVLIDGDGRRLGEHAYTVEFTEEGV
jgi:hypothetical protein